MGKKKLNTDLDDSLKQSRDDDYSPDPDTTEYDPAPEDSDEEQGEGFTVSENGHEGSPDDVTYTMGDIQVAIDEEDEDEDETVVVLPDADKEEDSDWNYEYNKEDKDEFLDQADFEYDDVGVDW